MLVGTIVDTSLLKGMPDYLGKNDTEVAAGLRTVASRKIGDAQGEAMKLANSFKEEYGSGVSTLINIYNGSGHRLSLRSTYDDSGHIGKYPYDSVIENGQWSAVLHTKTAGGATGSCGAVGYQFGSLVLAIAWDTPYSGSNSAWCKVEDQAKEYSPTPWSTYIERAEKGPASGSAAHHGYTVRWSIGDSSSPLFTVLLT